MRRNPREERSGKMRRDARPGRWLPWVFSLVLSLVLWIVAIQDRTFTITSRLPVDPPSLPQDLMLVGDIEAESVTVDFSGRGAQVLWDQVFRNPSSVRPGEINPDNTAGYPQDFNYSFSETDVVYGGTRPGALAPELFNPAGMRMEIDRKATREIPVSVPLEGDIPGRFMWPILSTCSVNITGAASIVMMMDSVHTEAVMPGEEASRVGIVLPQGISGSTPQIISASFVPPVPVVFRDDN